MYSTPESSVASAPLTPRIDEHNCYVSLLRGIQVLDANGQILGKIRDFILKVEESGEPPVSEVVIRTEGGDRRVATQRIEELGYAGMRLMDQEMEQAPFTRREGEMLIIEDLLDSEVIDRKAIRVLRVNDALLIVEKHHLSFAGIDASVSGLARRLVPRSLAQRFHGEILGWARIEPVPTPGMNFKLSHARLGALHPSDIAKLIDHLSYRSGGELLCGLNDEAAADTLEEMEKHRQPEILDCLPQDRAVAILNHMAPDAAADLLQNLPREQSDKLIHLLEPTISSNLKLLLSYPENTAAGLMTTDFVMAREGETVGEALSYVRAQLRKPDLIYYIYVVDNAHDRRLKGVISLRDLLLAETNEPLDSYTKAAARTVYPDEPAKEVTRIMGEYNLIALPVVDESGRILGLVTADDVLDLMLPESMRRHLPKLFS